MLEEPLCDQEAKKLAANIVASGTVFFSRHARKEMTTDGVTEVEVIRALRGGRVELSELIDGTWRYRQRAGDLCVVLAFRSDAALSIVTVWRVR